MNKFKEQIGKACALEFKIQNVYKNMKNTGPQLLPSCLSS